MIFFSADPSAKIMGNKVLEVLIFKLLVRSWEIKFGTLTMRGGLGTAILTSLVNVDWQRILQSYAEIKN